jgi:AmiR/NasT family two-component response regulator
MSSDMLALRLAELSLPPDPVAVAQLCALTMESLREAEATVTQLQAALGLARRIGIARGIVMATHRVSEDQAAHMLRKHSHELTQETRRLLASAAAAGIVTEPTEQPATA